MAIVCLLLQVYFYAVFGRILLSWFPVSPGGLLATVNSTLFTVTEPVLGPLRRMIPPVRLGMGALDLSPMVILIGIPILQRALGC